MKLKSLLIATSVVWLSMIASAHAAVALPKESRVPGGIALVPVPGTDLPPTVIFNTHRVAVVRKDNQWIAVVGIPLAEKPGELKLKVSTPDGTTEVPFSIKDKSYRTQKITV